MISLLGFYRELRHGRADGPSIHDAMREEAADNEVAIVNYLERGSVLATTGKLVDDVLDPDSRRVAPLDTRTDGEWIWPGDLAYYVGRYHLDLPRDFINHAESRGWAPPDLSVDELMEVASEIRPS